MFTQKQLTIQIINNIAKTLVVIVISAVVIALIGKKITHDSKQLQQKITLAKLAENRNVNADLLKQKIAPLGDIDAQIESSFPTTDNILDFVSAMDNLANKTAVKQSLHFQPPVALPESNDDLSLSSI